MRRWKQVEPVRRGEQSSHVDSGCNRMKSFVVPIFVLSALLLATPAGAEPTAAEKQEFLEVKAQAEAGDVNAQYKLAGMYTKGAGTDKDDAAAVHWFRKVAEQNDRRGQSMLGVMYTNARGVPRDYELAIQWFRKAAAQQSAHAQYNLGHMYATGKGVTQDDAESAAWYRKAAEQNDLGSQRILGSLYAAGRGVPQDMVQAYAWTKVACDDASAPAKQQLLKFEMQMTAEQKAAANAAVSEIVARLAKLKKS